MRPLLIDGPLIFGDPAQIRKIRAAEREVEAEEIRKTWKLCSKCADGVCPHCQQECPECDGYGRVE